jgi:hypothetical protein
MEDGDNLYDILTEAIGDDEGSTTDDELAGSNNPARPSERGKLGQLVDAVTDTFDHSFSRHGAILGNVVGDGIE